MQHTHVNIVFDSISHELCEYNAKTDEKKPITSKDQDIVQVSKKILRRMSSRRSPTKTGCEEIESLAGRLERVATILEDPTQAAKPMLSDAVELAMKISTLQNNKDPTATQLLAKKLNARAFHLQHKLEWAPNSKSVVSLGKTLLDLKSPKDAFPNMEESKMLGQDWMRYLQRDQVSFEGFEIGDLPGERLKQIELALEIIKNFDRMTHQNGELVKHYEAQMGGVDSEEKFAKAFQLLHADPPKDDKNEASRTLEKYSDPLVRKMFLALSQRFFVEPSIAAANLLKTQESVRKDFTGYPGSQIVLSFDEKKRVLTATGKCAFCSKIAGKKLEDGDPIRYLVRYEISMTLDLKSEEPEWEYGGVQAFVGVPEEGADTEKVKAVYQILEVAGLNPAIIKCTSKVVEDNLGDIVDAPEEDTLDAS